MPRSNSADFIYQLFALLLAVIVVHAAYVAWVRPAAQEAIIEQQQALAEGREAPARTLSVVIKDYEQEACLVLLLWALAIMARKAARARREHLLLDRALLELPEDGRITPASTERLSQPLHQLVPGLKELLLPRTLLTALQRFGSTGDIAASADSVRQSCQSENERLDSELALVRYIAWAIPSIGFIGTVRGIGDALGQAHRAVAGDIAGVTASLGVAFNSTFIALVVSIVVMFVMHQLQLLQERLVLDTQHYCDQYLLPYLHADESSANKLRAEA